MTRSYHRIEKGLMGIATEQMMRWPFSAESRLVFERIKATQMKRGWKGVLFGNEHHVQDVAFERYVPYVRLNDATVQLLSLTRYQLTWPPTKCPFAF